MSWNDYLARRARNTAGRRKRIYGIEPSPVIAALLARKEVPSNAREALRLFAYVYLKSPKPRLKIFWRRLTDRDTPIRKQHIYWLAADLASHLSKQCRITTHFFERRNYSKDLARVPPLIETALYRTTPSLAVQPGSERDISDILSYCQSKRLAVFPRGSASYAFGGAVPTRNGIVIDLSPMMDVLEINPATQTVRVQPGARWADVAEKLEPYGLVPVTTPSSRFSTVAGWISTGGIGLDSFGYGGVRESVIAVRIARADGSIEILDAKYGSIEELFGTEGQFGILTEITLRVRPKPECSSTYLPTFDSPDRALAFISQLQKNGLNPSHVAFFDRNYMIRENELFHRQTGRSEPLFPEQDAVLLHFDASETERKFIASLDGNAGATSRNRLAAQILWAERYFPFKAQRLGPGLLGSETVIPQGKVSRYITKVRRLGRHFKIRPAIEVILSRHDDSFSCLVITAFNCDYDKFLHYSLSLLFLQLSVKLAVRQGGHPYGIGIWNTPFIRHKYGRTELEKLKTHKRNVDPNGTLNPNKFFEIKGRFYNVPALFMHPMIFQPLMTISAFFAPVLGLASRMFSPSTHTGWDLPPPERNRGRDFLHQCVQRCTFCGACVSVCPAYRITQDELVAGRTKLRMAEALMKGIELDESEAHAPFQCLHCGLCEEVCQTRLPLRDCYLILESWLENRYGSPAETVRSFIEKLDSEREAIKEVFGLELPDWRPDEGLSRVPAVERPASGEKA